jgi:hypothetical protein
VSAKHSPGPWSMEDWGILDAEGHQVLHRYDDSTPARDHDLIAAAPELLDALKEEHGMYMDEYVGPTGRDEHASGCPVCGLIARIEGP